MGRPPISVIIPSYNCASYLGNAIESCLRQSVPPMEVIVVDDGSTDDTESVLRSYENTPLVKVRRQDNAGVAAARNAGVAISGGEYLVFLDSDDELLPEDFAVKSSIIAKYPDIDLFVCDYMRSYVPGLMNRTFPSLNAEKIFQSYCASRDDEVLRLNGAFPVAYAKAYVPHALLWTGAVMLRRRLFDRVGGFRPDLQVAEDSDMWRRCLASGNSAVIPGHCSAIYFRWRGPKGKFETACIEEVRKIKKEMEGASVFSASYWKSRKKIAWRYIILIWCLNIFVEDKKKLASAFLKSLFYYPGLKDQPKYLLLLMLPRKLVVRLYFGRRNAEAIPLDGRKGAGSSPTEIRPATYYPARRM